MASRTAATLRAASPRPRYEFSAGALVWVVAAVASVWLLAQIWQVLLIVVGALILVGTLNPYVSKAEARGASRTVAVSSVFLILLTTLALTLLWVAPPLYDQLS